jgi:preprotein translocase SecE subunit
MSATTKSPVNKLIQYFKDVVREGKLISWPDYKHVGFQFVIVTILSTVLTCLLFGMDKVIASGIDQLKHVILHP